MTHYQLAIEVFRQAVEQGLIAPEIARLTGNAQRKVALQFYHALRRQEREQRDRQRDHERAKRKQEVAERREQQRRHDLAKWRARIAKGLLVNRYAYERLLIPTRLLVNRPYTYSGGPLPPRPVKRAELPEPPLRTELRYPDTSLCGCGRAFGTCDKCQQPTQTLPSYGAGDDISKREGRWQST